MAGRWRPPSKSSLVVLFWVAGFILVFLWQGNSLLGDVEFPLPSYWKATSAPLRLRPVAYNLTEFGAVGDGQAVNTKAFEAAVAAVAQNARLGGAQLNVPPGRWLTGPFNLTSHMTLFLSNGAVILGIQDERHWPVLPPLPSYGYGRELKGPRFGSLVHGQNLEDVVITGDNGTIDGQGRFWWVKFRKKQLKYTRGPLVQLMWSKDIVVSNVTLRDSPFWTLHTYDCKNVTVSNMTVLAPTFGAPNTDGINPDSCEDMVIENSYISVGDDAIAIKSGWDQYGIAYGRPSTNIVINNVTARSMVSAGVSIGSEMSGGVSNVTVKNLHVWDSRRGVRIKTAPGRGAYVSNISYNNVTLDNVRVGIVIKTDYNEHPDEGFDPNATPVIKNISYTSIRGQEVRVPVRIQGSAEVPIKDITFRDVSIGIADRHRHIFQCAFVAGRAIGYIFPTPCKNLDLYTEEGQLVTLSASQNVSDVDYSFR